MIRTPPSHAAVLLAGASAALLAQGAGMPTRGSCAATNRNRTFVDYLEHGRATPTASHPTLSNAMDVGAPSNLERIRWMYGDDVGRLRCDVTAFAVSDDETKACIARVHSQTGYVLDPHAAVGWRAMERARSTGSGPYVVLATAHPCKFPDVVEAVTGVEVRVPAGLADRLSKPERVVHLPADLRALRDHLLLEAPE